MTLEISHAHDAAVINLKVVPASSRTRIASVLADALKVNIAAPPERGKANKELITFFAKIIGCPKSTLTITAGEHNNHKQLAVAGLTPEQLRQRIAPHLPQT